MTPHPETESPPQRKTLVSVERQYETDVATGQTATRMFVKMYFAARDSGHQSMPRACSCAWRSSDWWPESHALRDRVQIAVNGKRRPYPIFPDAFFKLTVNGRGGLRAFLEIDMGTEPIERGTRSDITAEGSDVAKKLRAYWQWGYVDKQHRGHPIYREHAPKGFVVLLAANSEDRAQSILGLADNSFRTNALPRSDMFWVATYDPHSKTSIYDLEWRTFKGGTRRLLDRA